MINQLVSGDMVRRELRDLSEPHGSDVVRLGAGAQSGFSVRDGDGHIFVVAMTDIQRKRVVDVAFAEGDAPPAWVLLELAHHVIDQQIDVAGFEGRCGLVMDERGYLHSVLDLPDELTLSSPLHFGGPYELRLPLRLVSTRDFVLIGAAITRTPDFMEIEGDTDLSECAFGSNSLPEGAVFRRNLVLSKSSCDNLPRRLSVGRWLKMKSTEIEVIPSSARIGGGIDAGNSELRVVPPGFDVMGDLILSGSRVRRLSGVTIRGDLFVERMPGLDIREDCEVDGKIFTDDLDMIAVSPRHASKVFVRNPFGYERPQASWLAAQPAVAI
ncbi:hypothetical protein G6L37_05415 [Agrobacterium rubi]|nr:hypothetical protein [Agrobacterium rubi]NTF24796.1 hypothetical protein [Agrobacterium rubi]